MVQYLIENLIAILGLIGGAISLFVSVGQYVKSKQIEIFSTYVEKYNAIVKPEIYDKWYEAVFRDNEEYWEELKPVMIAYLNLVWEEVHLREKDLISSQTWKIWKKEILRIIRSRFAREILGRYKYPNMLELLDKY